MQIIYKYAIPLQPEPIVHDIPGPLQFLTLQKQHDLPHIWCIVNTDAPIQSVPFYWFATGQELYGKSFVYLGTQQMNAFTYHLFTKKEIFQNAR